MLDPTFSDIFRHPAGRPVPGVRTAAADVIIVGRVVGMEDKDVEISPFPGSGKVSYRIAVVQVGDGVMNAKGLTTIRVVSTTAAPTTTRLMTNANNLQTLEGESPSPEEPTTPRQSWLRRWWWVVVLVTVTAAVAVLEPDQLASLRPALLAAVTYTSNWWQAGHHQSYFAVFGPPPPVSGA